MPFVPRRPKAPIKGQPVAVLLALLALATLLPFVALGAITLTRYVAAERAREVARLEGTADSLAKALDREFRSLLDEAKAIAASNHLTAGNLAEFETVLRTLASTARGHFILHDSSARQVINTAAPRGLTLPESGRPARVRQIIETGQPSISDLRAGPIVKDLLFGASVPVEIENEKRYVLSYVPRLGLIQAVVEQTFTPGNWTAAVIDGSGLIVARSYDPEDFFGRPIRPEFGRQMEASRGVVNGIDGRGVSVVTAFARPQLANWRVAVWTPVSVLEKGAAEAFWLIAWASLLSILASGLVGTLAAGLVARPVKSLADAAKALGQQRAVEFQPSGMREANVVGEALIEASERVSFVMRELSHRTKNLLAVIQAIARQTAVTASDKDDLSKRLNERLRGLARSHDLLVNEDWRGTGLAELVKSQLEMFISGDDGRLIISGPPVLLTPSCSQHIGMALHELATNAHKYGALSVPSGRVEVTWHWGPVAGSTEEGIHLQWREVGGPTVAEPSRRGFGHVVVEQMVAAGVNGTAKLEWRPEGVVWSMVAAASCAVRR